MVSRLLFGCLGNDNCNNCNMTIAEYTDIICEHFLINKETLRKKSRKKDYVMRRQLSAYLIYQDNKREFREGWAWCDYNMKDVAYALGIKHPNLIHNIKCFQNLIDLYPKEEYVWHYNRIKEMIARRFKEKKYICTCPKCGEVIKKQTRIGGIH